MRRTVFLIQASVLLLVFDLLTVAGIARIHRYVARCRVSRRTVTPESIADVLWAVDEACVWYPHTVHCLQRSVAGAVLLRRQGWRAELVIGCRPFPLDSHAWVEIDNRVVNDRPQYKRAFRELERI